MSYRIAGAFFVAAGLALMGLAFYGAFLSRPEVHLVRPEGHYLLKVRWVAGWALFAAFLAGCAFRYCRNRARNREPGAVDVFLFGVAKILCGVAALLLSVGWLLTPTIIK